MFNPSADRNQDACRKGAGPAEGSRKYPLVLPLLLLAASVLLGSLHPESLQAMMLRIENSELVGRSDLIVSGEVRMVQSDSRGILKGSTAQEAIVSVEGTLKGKSEAEIRVAFSTGMEDSPSFVAGERVLLFLKKIGPRHYQTVGGIQGKFTLDIPH